MKIEAEIENLKKILVDDEKFYQIPDYQRPYSWDKDNLSDLIDDLVSAYLDNKKETYFCGSLVLVNNESDSRFDIIDGQQRTTTFTIISCVFRDVYLTELGPKAKDFINSSIQDKYEDSKRKLKFLTNEQYQIDFEETVLKGIDFKPTRNIEKDLPNNKYLQNAHYIKGFLEEKFTENDINVDDFVIWFFENVVLTVITCPSQDSAIKIFNVLNDRGMPLSSIDILKSTLMQKLDGKEDRNAFKVKWESINSNLKFSNFDLDSMLNTYLYYKLSTNPKSRLDKELIGVFDKEGKSALEIIKEIGDFSVSYVKILNEENKYLYCLKYLRHRIYWVSIMSTALYTNYPEIEELKKLLVAYYYQNWIAGATVARIKQTSFNILKLIKSGAPISDISTEMQDSLKKYSTTKTFKEELEGSWVYGRKWDRAILLLVEYFSSDDSKQSYISIGSKLHLEHILPQNPDDEAGWKNIFSSEEREEWTNSLANLTLLSMRKNIQAHNYSYVKKVEAYQDKDNVVTPFLITQDVIKCGKWDTEELEKREKNLSFRIMGKLDVF
ncbi:MULTISPECIES: DUF262 domain-containing protein [unclassified Pseudoalteromonas]|uniref:DUF262 domain-containing protein n=1 Tax=Pseudoalteromonas sp. RB2-MNA-CIBAN-0110 TaxID=3140439 RepID=UPI0003FE843D|nr:DUF262 domain-containing protein [Pseudoalteromonas sp. TB13]